MYFCLIITLTIKFKNDLFLIYRYLLRLEAIDILAGKIELDIKKSPQNGCKT